MCVSLLDGCLMQLNHRESLHSVSAMLDDPDFTKEVSRHPFASACLPACLLAWCSCLQYFQ